MGEKKIKPYDDMDEKVKYVSISYHDLERELSVVQATMATKEQLNVLDMKFSERTNNLEARLSKQMSDLDRKSLERTNDLEAKLSKQIDALDRKSLERTNDLEVKLLKQMSDLDMKFSERTNTLELKIHGMEERMVKKFTLIFGVPITFFGLILSGIQMLNFIKPTLTPYPYSNNVLQHEEPVGTQRFTIHKAPSAMASQKITSDHKLQNK